MEEFLREFPTDSPGSMVPGPLVRSNELGSVCWTGLVREAFLFARDCACVKVESLSESDGAVNLGLLVLFASFLFSVALACRFTADSEVGWLSRAAPLSLADFLPTLTVGDAEVWLALNAMCSFFRALPTFFCFKNSSGSSGSGESDSADCFAAPLTLPPATSKPVK